MKETSKEDNQKNSYCEFNSFQSLVGIIPTFPYQTHKAYSNVCTTRNITIEIITMHMNISENLLLKILNLFKEHLYFAVQYILVCL